MKLTNVLRKQLACSLAEDQFKNEMQKLKKDLDDAVIRIISDRDNGDSVKLLKAFKELQKANPENSMLCMGVQQSVTLYYKDSTYKVRVPNFDTHSKQIIMQYYVNIKRVTLPFSVVSCNSISLDFTNHPILIDIFESMVKVAKEWEALFTKSYELLCAYSTVEKLKADTKAFDTFLPPPPVKNTNLVPVETLLEINSLTIPKNAK